MRFILIMALSAFTFVLQALEIVIVGGGPSGLATAIEAHQTGANVTIVEKRNGYSRGQLLMLFNHSLELLKKWDVSIPSMRVANLDSDHLVGVSLIKDLEEALAKRVHVLGISVLKGEFIDIGVATVTISEEGAQRKISYDILVGADGVYSPVRNALAIPCNVVGSATAIGTLIPLPDPERQAELPAATFRDGLFVKRLFLPHGRFIVLQYPLTKSDKINKSLDKEALITAAQTAGWIEEAECIASGKAVVRSEIPIVLQQANTFFNEEKSAILVGDAAASAPFCQALGANTALRTAEIAGELFAQLIKDKNHSYAQFNAEVKEATDAMVLDSAYLVEQGNDRE